MAEQDTKFMIKDFIPLCIESGGVFSIPKFEPFPALVERANQFLQQQPEWETRTCESVEFKCKHGEVINSEKMTYFEHGQHVTNVLVRGLRLWLVRRKAEQAQQIGYVNIVPQAFGSYILSWPKFQTLDETIQTFNNKIRVDPDLIPGKVLTIETQKMYIREIEKFDPNKSTWIEGGRGDIHFVFVLRAFYELHTEKYCENVIQEIGVMDFIPSNLNGDVETYSQSQFEPFSNVIGRASKWCTQQNDFKFCNAQSFEIKAKIGERVGSQKMTYTDLGDSTVYFARVLRVAYVKLSGVRMAQPLNLNCKNFVPCPVRTNSGSVDEYESLSKTMERVDEWLHATGAQVFSCETVAMRWASGGEKKLGIETSFTYNSSRRSHHWLHVIRIFLDGPFEEPPPSTLSPVPLAQVATESCFW